MKSQPHEKEVSKAGCPRNHNRPTLPGTQAGRVSDTEPRASEVLSERSEISLLGMVEGGDLD